MDQAVAEQLVKSAALEAVQLYEKSQKKCNRTKVFHNAKKLMENYNRIHQGVIEGISELSYLDDRSSSQKSSEEDIYINSILKSKLRSIVMIAHLDKCMKLLKEEQIRKNAPEKFEAFKLYYLDNVTQEEIAEILHSTDRTIRRWVSEATEILSVYLFGADAIVLE